MSDRELRSDAINEILEVEQVDKEEINLLRSRGDSDTEHGLQEQVHRTQEDYMERGIRAARVIIAYCERAIGEPVGSVIAMYVDMHRMLKGEEHLISGRREGQTPEGRRSEVKAEIEKVWTSLENEQGQDA